jgi:hypothetical protein
MSAAVRSDRLSRTKRSTQRSHKSPGLRHSGHLQVVPSIPTLPPQVRLLLVLRRFSTPIAVGLVVGVLPIYGWSVMTQHSWGQRWQHLQTLRQDERHLSNESESQTHTITQKVQNNPSGFVPLSPQNSVFLKPQPPQPAPQNSPNVLPDLAIDLETPLAY